MKQPQVGTVVLGRYSLLRQIGRGGMSTIWAAEDRQLQRSVAVKLLSGVMAESERVRRRFEREAMAVARLQSPNIVQVFDYGIDNGQPVIVMELLHGEDLRQRLRGKQKLPLQGVVEIVKQCARGLGEAHGAGIIHRDLKPGNIFLARDRQQGVVVKILDFGVAKGDSSLPSTGKTTKAGDIIGTPHFMSPEQARAKDPVDHRTDLWSLGVIIYRMVCGRLPFKGHNPAQILIAAATESFRPPTVYAPEFPPEIDDFMQRALSRDREKRFSSAGELLSALTAIQAKEKARRVRSPDSVDDEATTVAAAATVRMPAEMLVPKFLKEQSAAPSMPPSTPPPSHDFQSEPPMSSHPSDAMITTDPSYGSLGNAMLSAPPPDRPRPPVRTIVTIVAGAAVLLLVFVAGAVVWSGGGAKESAPSPAAVEVPPPAETDDGDESAAAPSAEEPPAATAAPSAVSSAEVPASASAEQTAALPPPVARPAPGPQRVAAPPKPVPRGPRPVPRPVPRPRKPGPDPYGSRF